MSHASLVSRRVSPELFEASPPPEKSRAQGRSGAGLSHGPPATKNAGGRYHRYGRGHPDPPCAMVLRFIRALPGDRLSCPRRLRRCASIIAELGISSGMPEPHDFTVVSESFVSMEIMLRPDTPTASR